MSEIKPAITRDFYAIITTAGGDKVLLFEDRQICVLPHWQAPKAFNSSVFTQWVIQTARELYGLQTILLKEYYFRRIFENSQFRGTHRVLVLQLQDSSACPEKAGWEWYGLEEIAGKKFAIPLHAELVQKWLSENRTGQIPPRRMPWASPGWFEKARSWAIDFVETQGWQLTGPIEQGKADIISAQLKIPSSVGNLYLKAVPPYFKSEPVFGALLEKLLPGRVPHILGSQVQDGWILMADFRGEPLANIADFSVWEAALRDYARLQIACVEHTGELLQAGVRDRRLEVLGEQLETVLGREDLWSVGEPMGLNRPEVHQLQAAIPRLQAMCVELAAFGLPETIDSGDFHAHNVALTSNGFVFYDWSDLSIAHPFVSLNPFGQYAENFADMADYWQRLTGAYLEPWQVFLPQPKLDEAYRLGFILGNAVQVLNYAWIHDNIEPEDYPNVDGGLIHFARKLLETLGK